MKLLGLLLILMASTAANAEKISYEIFSFSGDKNCVLIAKGVKEYSSKDIEVQERGNIGDRFWSKYLNLEQGYSLGASIYRKAEIDGFGLWIKKDNGGFSWEWFNLCEDGIYKKLQEDGEVRVSYTEIEGNVEISEIEFLTDISRRLNETKKVGVVTKRVLIRKGGILKFKP